LPQGYIQVIPGSHSPVVAGLLSLCCIVSFGQFYNRQFQKGAAMLLVSMVAAAVTGGMSTVVTFPFCVVDAVLVASKLNRGQPVREWEFF